MSTQNHHLSTPQAVLADVPTFVLGIQWGEDYYDHLIGKYVRVIGKSHFKDYQGVVKSTQQDGWVLVELRATNQQQRFHVNSLALLYVISLAPILSN